VDGGGTGMDGKGEGEKVNDGAVLTENVCCQLYMISVTPRGSGWQ
jgi:hypothetical protein